MAASQRKEFVTVSGMKVEVERRGKGNPLVLIHGEEALEKQAPFADELAKSFELIIPSPPGYGQSERPLWLTRPDDLAFVLLDVLAALKIAPAATLGFSVGGWIAAEMATIQTDFTKKLALVAPVGIKLGGPTDRDIADVWLLNPAKVNTLKWHDAEKGKRNFVDMPEEQLTEIARNSETTARFCWEPYMHNPKLKHRLHRVKAQTLMIWGAEDGIVKAETYGKGYAALIQGATLSVIPKAGHFPHIEQPGAFLKVLGDFIG